MRKFKLLKFYPSLNRDWKEGLVVIKDSDDFYRPTNIINSPGRIIASFVEDYPEFWEEIIENNSKRLLYKGNILYNVKRLSDNQEFTIGDKVLNSRNELKTILGFVDTCNIQVELGTGNFVDYIDNLCNIQHYKTPILITEDGYECTLDDRVFGVLPKANWQTNYYGKKGVPVFKLFNPEGKRWNPSSEWLWFKTKENAEKYIYENKPEFSRKQILDVISKISINEPYLFGFKYDKPVVCVDVFKLNLQL